MSRFTNLIVTGLQALIAGVALLAVSAVAKTQAPAPSAAPGFASGVQLLTPTEGVDFVPYVHNMLPAIKRKWMERIPEDAMMGEKGTVAVVFAVRKDGSLGEGGPQIDSSSRNKSLDKAALEAVRASAPFEHLPEGFKGPEMKFRMHFLYNIPPPKEKH